MAPLLAVRPRGGDRLPLALAIAAAITACFWVALPAHPDFDDPYIALHSAQSLVARSDANYGVSGLHGATSPLHVALLAGLLALGLGGFEALRLVSALGATALAVSLWLLAGQLRLGSASRALLVLTVFASGLTWVQVASGLETAWTMAAVTTLIALHLGRRHAAVAVLAGLLPWLRPDATIIGAAVLAASLTVSPGARLRLTGIALLSGLVPGVWYFTETGAWWPVTIGAKARFFAEACAPLPARLARLGGGVWSWWVAVLPLGLGLAGAGLRPLGRLGLVAAVVSLAAFLVLLPGGVWHNHHRYLYPVFLPWAAYGLGILAAAAGRRAPLVLALCAAAGVVHTPDYWRPHPAGAAELAAVSAWIEQHTPADAHILVQDAGAPAVFTSRSLTDIVGLKTPLSLEAHAQWTWPTCGAARGTAVAAIARQSSAGYLVTSADWDAEFGFTADLRAHGFQVEPVRLPPSHWPGGYTVHRLVAPDEASR